MRHPTNPKLLLALGLMAAVACDCGDEPPTAQCMTDMDCREGERCTPDMVCVVGVECVADEECTAEDQRKQCNLETFMCEFREGFADDCDGTRPCPFGQFCSELLGRCFDATTSRDCVRRAQCPANQICDRKANKCIPDPGCYGDEFCEDGEFCDLVNRTCRAVAVECTSCALDGMCPGSDLCFTETSECLISIDARACNDGETCDPLGRCVQCTSSAECGPGLFCNVSLGRCESNVQCVNDPSECPSTSEVTCVECMPPEVCDARTRRCSAPPMPCDDDVDCPNDQFCDTTLEPPICIDRVPECLNDLIDEMSPNDSISTATLLDPADGPDYDELRICPGDQDWFRLDVEAGTYLTIDARFENAIGDIELELYLADGRTILDASRSTSDNERVELEVGTDLTVYLRAFLGRPGINAAPYRLIVARDPGSICMDDAAEPNDSRDDAKQLVNDIAVEGRVCTGDPDWFVLRGLQPGSQITTTLDFVDNLGDLDLELYRANATQPTLVAASLDDNEELVFNATYGGDYFLRIVGKGADTNVYTLRAQIREGVGPTCVDDMWEPNDTPLTATATGALPTGLAMASICGGDEDWYRFRVGLTDAVTAEIGFDPSADLDLKLFRGDVTDPNATPLRESIGTTGREYIAFRNFEAEGEYLLRVYGQSPQDTAEYELNLQVRPFTGCQPDFVDVMNQGNSLMDAYQLMLPPTRVDDLSFCDTDTDFYRVFLQGGFVNVLRINFVPDDAILEARLLDTGGGLIFSTEPGLGQAPNPAGFRELLVNVPGQGFAVVILQVTRSQGFATDYNITLDLQPLFDCVADVAEPNNTPATASLVASSSVAPVMIDDLSLCTSVRDAANVGDEDFFVLNPPVEGARIDAEIVFENGDLSLELFSPNGGPRACVTFGDDRCYSDGNTLREHITFTATTTDPYLLKVSSVWSGRFAPGVRPNDADTSYDLSVTYTLP